MVTPVTIDFVSDVSCPWCAIGLKALEQAISQLGSDYAAAVRFRPFELNPDMPAEGESVDQHMARKYGAQGLQTQMARMMITQRGAEVGFKFNLDKRTRIYNTFDAHRLMHWAEREGRQHALASALFAAYFTDGENPGDPQVLIRLAEAVGLDGTRARAILASDEFATDVREMEVWAQSNGVNGVPFMIINGKHVIQGAQPSDTLILALRQIAQRDGA